jgi:predicted GNAT family acetyltransferase/glutaredoxin
MTITMYGADWCGDCLRAKAWFAANDVAYSYVNLEEVPEAADIVLERNNGLKRIPVIVFPDDSHLTEPSNEALDAKMAELAGQSVEPSLEVVENADAGQFQLLRDGDIVSVADFSERDGAVVIPHVGTSPEHRGQGYAGRLMDGTLDLLRTTDRTVVPLCPFAAQHIRDNERHQDLLATN